MDLDLLPPSGRLRILDVPVHKNTDAMINSRDMVPHAVRLSLHCPVEILWLESSCSTSEIDLPLGSSRLDPHVGPSCVLDRLVVGQFVLTIFSLCITCKLEHLSTYHN